MIAMGTCFRPLTDEQIQYAKNRRAEDWPVEFRGNLVLNEGVPLFHGDPLWFMWHYLHLRPNLFPPGTNSAWLFEMGRPTWEAYTQLVSSATQIGAEYLMVVEDDVFIPPQTVHMLYSWLERNKDYGAAGGLYAWRHQKDQGEFFQIFKGNKALLDFPRDQMVEVDAGGLGCMMFRMSALAECELPLFSDDFMVNGFPCHAGDLCVQYRLREAGYKIGVHTGIKCWHRDPYTGTFYPQELRAEYDWPERPMTDFAAPDLALAGRESRHG